MKYKVQHSQNLVSCVSNAIAKCCAALATHFLLDLDWAMMTRGVKRAHNGRDMCHKLHMCHG